jgi:hypothetical protein
MLYTVVRPESRGDPVYLFPSTAAARAATDGHLPPVGVAVRFDGPSRRVLPLWTDAERFDPEWSAPARIDPDGSIVARGPIPGPLFVV